ncbi:acyl carrier protein [Halobacteriovorax sp. BALOs_7]|nr:acyl carrier protein [Halobacteriovorax sp. BALOs_7]
MKNKITEILTETLECEVNENTSMESCEEWDSFNHINIIIELKSQFNIDIPTDDISLLNSYSNIVNYIKNKQN